VAEHRLNLVDDPRSLQDGIHLDEQPRPTRLPESVEADERLDLTAARLSMYRPSPAATASRSSKAPGRAFTERDESSLWARL